MNGWIDEWGAGGRIVRTHTRKAYRQTRTLARRRACMHADTHVRHAHSNAGNTSRDKALGPLPGTVLCRICRIRRSGNRRTGAQLQRERVDRAAGTSGIEVDAAVDCVPVATGHVGSLQVIAHAASVGLLRDESFGRTLACLLVVEREEARRAGRAV
jgi:hypothetical protein